jgi:hypothetical protein
VNRAAIPRICGEFVTIVIAADAVMFRRAHPKTIALNRFDSSRP